MEMYPYLNEEVAWQRLQDLQREMENSRLMAHHTRLAFADLKRLAARVWWVAGLAAQRPPRRRPTLVVRHQDDRTSEVA
jgi:hypothetical protein